MKSAAQKSRDVRHVWRQKEFLLFNGCSLLLDDDYICIHKDFQVTLFNSDFVVCLMGCHGMAEVGSTRPRNLACIRRNSLGSLDFGCSSALNRSIWIGKVVIWSRRDHQTRGEKKESWPLLGDGPFRPMWFPRQSVKKAVAAPAPSGFASLDVFAWLFAIQFSG